MTDVLIILGTMALAFLLGLFVGYGEARERGKLLAAQVVQHAMRVRSAVAEHRGALTRSQVTADSYTVLASEADRLVDAALDLAAHQRSPLYPSEPQQENR